MNYVHVNDQVTVGCAVEAGCDFCKQAQAENRKAMVAHYARLVANEVAFAVAVVGFWYACGAHI